MTDSEKLKICLDFVKDISCLFKTNEEIKLLSTYYYGSNDVIKARDILKDIGEIK